MSDVERPNPTHQYWAVGGFSDCPGIVHISPEPDEHEHRIHPDGACWCGAWSEFEDGCVLVHHLNLTERLSLIMRA